jgi:hypothetical protein
VTRQAIGSHQSARMLEERWLTPPYIIDALGPFDLDPCAAPDPRPWPTAARHITRPDDGLAAGWQGRVFLNPPYGPKVSQWLGRLAAHPGGGTAFVFARTETSWFTDHVWGRATALLFLAGRIHFHHPDGTRARANAGAPSVLVAYSSYDAERLETSGLYGTYFRNWIRLGVPSADGQLSLLEAGA